MTALLSVLLFALIFGLSLFLGVRYWAAPNAAIDRVLDQETLRAARRPVISWSYIPRFIGDKLAARSDAEKKKWSFLQAGVRSPNAETAPGSLKIVAPVAGGVLFAVASLVRGAEPGTAGMAAIAGAGLGLMVPGEVLRSRVKRRKRRIEKALPNALDLLTIGVEAGLGLDQAIIHVADQLSRAYPEISAEFAMINLETRAGKRRADSLRAMAERTGASEVKKLVAVLIQADRFGTSVAQSLRAHAEHLRIQASQRAEEKAAKLGVKMVFPIFFFILPSLFVMTVGPMLVRLFKDLLPMMNSM